MLAMATLVLGAACSAIIDVEPNCDTVSNCGGYQCNAENTACLDSCRTDGDCVSGFGCDTSTSLCVASGCFPQGGTLENGELQHDWTSFASGYAGDLFVTGVVQPGEPAQALFYSLSGGVLRYGGGGPQFFTLSDRQTRDQNEIAMYFGSERQVNNPNGGVLALWVDAMDTNPRFHLRTNTYFDGAGFTPDSWSTLAERGTRPIGLGIRPIEGGFVTAWLEQDGVNSSSLSGRLSLAIVGLDGLPTDSGAVSRMPPEGSSLRVRTRPALARSNNGVLFAVGVQGGTGNQFSIYGGAFGDSVPQHLPEQAWHTSGMAISDVIVGSSGPQAAVVWRQARSGGGHEILSRRLNIEGRLLDSTEQPVRVDPLFTHANRSRANMVSTDGRGGFAVAFTGSRGSRTGLWVAHFGEDAKPIGLPFFVTDSNIPLENLVKYDIVATDAGYVVQWMLEGSGADSGRTMFYRSFKCDP